MALRDFGGKRFISNVFIIIIWFESGAYAGGGFGGLNPPPPPPTERLFGRRDFQIFLSLWEMLDPILKPPLEKILRTPLVRVELGYSRGENSVDRQPTRLTV